VKTLCSQKLRMLLTHRELLQSKAIAIVCLRNCATYRWQLAWGSGNSPGDTVHPGPRS
jgi:hypothetical protein